MKLFVVAVLVAAVCAGFSDGGDRALGSNYGGWETGGIMCNSSHNGWQTNQGGVVYTCGFAYDPGSAFYAPGWGFVNSCPVGQPYYGYCWRWQE